TVTDTLPTGLAPTAADNGLIDGWTITTSGQTITATRTDALAPGSSYPMLTVTVSVANVAPASVTNTATVAGGGEVNAPNVTTNGQTITATRSDVLGGARSYAALTLRVRIASNAPASVTNTATVACGGEVNTANDTASDVTTITPAPDLAIAISHSGDFTAG